MKTIPVKEIEIPKDRQRRLFDPAKLHEFADGIAVRGLLHPVVLRITKEGRHCLVAGERRLRAITDLADLGQSIFHDGNAVELGSIPYTLLSELDALSAEEAELEENIHRENLTWQERASAHARIAGLRGKQAAARGDTPPTVADISLEVRGSAEGVNQETTRRELIVANHLDNPLVKAAKTVDEAFKILRKEESAAKNRALGEQVGRTFSAEMHTALNEDSLGWLQSAREGQFDVILTDPPYGMGADEFGDSGFGGNQAHGYADNLETWTRLMEVLVPYSFTVTKEQAHLYMFLDIANFPRAKEMFASVGWQVFRTPLIWYKKTGARAPWPDSGPQRKYECILYAVKGKRSVMKMAGDVLDFPLDSSLGHRAQKPVALFQELLSRSVLPGNAVLDPFMGSGPIFSAAHALKCRATGIEMDQGSFGIAVKRLEGLKAQQELDLGIGL